jgi:hypothetical protein
LTLFAITLAAAWLIFVLIAFCPLLACRRRREIEAYEET